MPSYSRDQVVAMLSKRVNGQKTAAGLAREIGVTPSVLSYVMTGKFEPTKKILDFLKLEKSERRYRRKRKSHD